MPDVEPAPAAEAAPTGLLDRVLALQQLLTADLDRFCADAGLTPARLHLLWELGASGPTSQRALARALGVTARNITGLVDGLVTSGHVTREADQWDRRVVRVTPTPSGVALVQRLRADHAALAEELFGDLAEDERRHLATRLEDLIGRLTRLIGEAR